jgi:hypothetical protein
MFGLLGCASALPAIRSTRSAAATIIRPIRRVGMGGSRTKAGDRAQLPYTVSTTDSVWSYDPTTLPRPPSTQKTSFEFYALLIFRRSPARHFVVVARMLAVNHGPVNTPFRKDVNAGIKRPWGRG